VDEEAEFELGGDEEFEIEDDGDDEAEFEFAGEEDDESDEDEAPVDLIDLAALWDQVATLPGGQASLLSGNQLGQDGIQVLVMVDGYTSLRGLRTLAPHVDDDRFHHIVHAAVVAGLLAFE
jgi:hypothetical protein